MNLKKLSKRVRIVLLCLFTVLLILLSWGTAEWFQIDSAYMKGESRIYTVQKGKKAIDVMADLSDKPLSPYWSQLWLRVHPEYRLIKAGTYKIEKGWHLKHALQLFVSGKEAVFSVTLVEGKRIDDWLDTLAQAPYLSETMSVSDISLIRHSLDIEQQNPEGWFLPETYSYTAGSTPLDILRRAHNDMVTFLDKAWKGRDRSVPYKSAYEALIMASIIEKETANSGERAKIASVFMNRLKKGMKLQTDPTVIYGVKDRYDGVIHRSDLDDVNPYNTYIITGLPPTPIAMPSKKSILAALHPDKTNYLYFVAKGQGGEHNFSITLDQHNQAVKHYLQSKK